MRMLARKFQEVMESSANVVDGIDLAVPEADACGSTCTAKSRWHEMRQVGARKQLGVRDIVTVN